MVDVSQEEVPQARSQRRALKRALLGLALLTCAAPIFLIARRPMNSSMKSQAHAAARDHVLKLLNYKSRSRQVHLQEATKDTVSFGLLPPFKPQTRGFGLSGQVINVSGVAHGIEQTSRDSRTGQILTNVPYEIVWSARVEYNPSEPPALQYRVPYSKFEPRPSGGP